MSEIKGSKLVPIPWPADLSKCAKRAVSEGCFEFKQFLNLNGLRAAYLEPVQIPIFFTGDSLADLAKGLAEVAEWIVAQNAKVDNGPTAP